MAQRFTLLCLEASPRDVLAIFKKTMGLSEKDHILEWARNGQDQHPQVLLTELFPGRAKGLPEVATCRMRPLRRATKI